MNLQLINRLEEAKKKKELELADVEARILQIKADLVYFKSALSRVAPAPEPSLKPVIPQRDRRRTPMKMKRPQYAGRSLAESIEKVLNDCQEPMLVDRIVEIIFDTQSEEEFWKAKNSLSVELREGAKGKGKKWKRISKYFYASLAFNEELLYNNSN